ncbi:MAG TPA: ABC-three component system middle component 7 [Flavobacterium sp.]|nr:ABC-three component system middle component 7 [Flavobacterium sp.]
MIYPNKHIKIEESIIYKMTALLEDETINVISINELYNKTKSKFSNIDEFIYSLDVLFLLDIIEINFESELITYVSRN